METLVAAEAVGLDVTEDWADLDRLLVTRAEIQVGRMQIAAVERNRLRAQLRDAERAGSAESEIASIRTRLQVAEQRVDGTVASVRRSADMLDRRGVETSQYRRIVIEATGQVTVDILDPKVLGGLLSDMAAGVRDWIGIHGSTVFVRLLIIVGVILIMRLAFRIGWRTIQKSGRVKLPRLMSDMLAGMVGPVATILGLLVALSFLGVNLGTLVAGVGVAGIIVGLALQDSMSNLAAGLFILIYRPYDVEDTVRAGGIVGTVRAMGLANTTVVTFDNRVLFVPNRKIWSEVIENRSTEQTRRVETTVRISYHADLDGAVDLLKDIARTHEKILEDPAPSAFVSELADSWIEVCVYCWVATEDWWPVTTELPRLIRLRFQAESIEVPYPRHIEERISADAENT
jgi:small conductance mechanosensitive channel